MNDRTRLGGAASRALAAEPESQKAFSRQGAVSGARPQPPLRLFGSPADSLRLYASALPGEARLVGFRGVERLSSPYRFEVAFSAPHEADFDMQAALGTRIAVEVGAGSVAPSRQHGVVASLELVEALPDRAIYLAVMVPEVWHLGHSVHSRIYTDVSLPAIIDAVLRFAAVEDFELSLVSDYPALEHVCQYRESDLAFISRLMERDGLYYFFEQSEERERLVITDHKSAHGRSEAGRVVYTPWSQEGGRDEGLERFRCRVSALPAAVRLSDYDPLRPTLPVRGDAAVSGGRGDIVLYGENLRSPADGERLARVRAEELLAQQAIYEGSGMQPALRAGYTFELERHPRADFNRGYLVTEIEHFGKAQSGVEEVERMLGLGDETYRVELRAITDEVQFRAARATPWPRIDGVADGVVDGSADSEYAQIDEHGRYRVRVFFDESDLVDGSGSAWVRMLQPHGGGVEGMHFPLRKGTEVHMVFLGGDPDRPVIVGTAPNAEKPSKVTAGNNTQNVLRSGANNQLVMEDSGGGEFVNMSTPNQSSFLHMGAGADNFVVSTGGNGREHVGGSRAGFIGGTFDETVGGAVSQSFGATMDQTVAGPVSQSFAATYDQNVAGPVTQAFAATQALSVTGNAGHAYAANLEVAIAGTLAQATTGAATLAFQSTVDETIDGAYSLTVNAVTSEAHNAPKSTTIAGSHTLSASGAQLIEGLASQTLHGASQQIEADGVQLLRSSSHVVETTSASVQASTIALAASGSATVDAADVTINAGPVGINAGDLAVSAGAVHVAGGGIVEISAGLIKLN